MPVRRRVTAGGLAVSSINAGTMSALVQAVILVIASLTAVQSVFYLRDPILTSPGLLPLMVSLAAAILAGALLVGEVLNGAVSLRPVRDMLATAAGRRNAGRVAGWLLLASAYAVATPVVGFMWATLAFLLIALGIFSRLDWWRTAILAVAIATIVPVIFRYVFFAIVP